VVTAFVIDSYKSLGGAASGDTTAALFQQLLLHMKEEIPAVTRAPSSTSPTATTSSICINALWFSSLVLSLNTVGETVADRVRAGDLFDCQGTVATQAAEI
jgi:hypothetical protein